MAFLELKSTRFYNYTKNNISIIRQFILIITVICEVVVANKLNVQKNIRTIRFKAKGIFDY